MAMEQSWSSQWIHPDAYLSPSSGVTYSLRYVAAVPILVSIKSVDLGTRTKIAKLSIHCVCHEVGLALPPLSAPDKLSKSFVGSPDLTWAMTDVYLKITSQAITVSCVKSGKFMFQHNLSVVSFASGGDTEAADFICYVAKSDQNKRMCFVFECLNKSAQDVIVTIGQAFQLGYQDFKHGKNPSIQSGNKTLATSHQPHHPASVNPNSVGDSKQINPHCKSLDNGSLAKHVTPHNHSQTDLSPSVAFNNLMDCDESSWLLGNEAPNGQVYTSTTSPSSVSTTDPPKEHPDTLTPNEHNQPNPTPAQDTTNKTLNTNGMAKQSMQQHFSRLEPVGEPWYVGKMSRIQAEHLLRYDGDFLVRASIQQPGQFVLSGLQDGRCKHLLLADPNGQVRTKDHIFDSIQHLIDFHVQTGIPICSTDSEIKLIFPVSTHQL